MTTAQDPLHSEFVKHMQQYRPCSVTARLATELKWQRRLSDKLQSNYDELQKEALELEKERNVIMAKLKKRED